VSASVGRSAAASPGPGAELDPARAPYLEAVIAFAARDIQRFHVPGHKGGLGADDELRRALGPGAFVLDLPMDVEGIDLGPSPTPYEQAEQLAARAYGAQRTWFLTNGATQGNHALCLALAPLGAEVVVQRNSHASIVDGLVLSGGVPHFVAPEYEERLGMAHGVTPAALAAALARAPAARTAFVVSPTYYGMAADIAGCVEVAHAADVALVVDQSWGPHFGFHSGLPASALQLGADAILTSTHKIVGSLTQSAMLHVAGGERVDSDAIARAIRLTRSTSSCSLLLASLDASRRQLAVEGEALLQRTLEASAAARAAIDEIEGSAVVGPELVGQPGVAAWDPLRITVDVHRTGCTGYDIAASLRAEHDVYVELATHATIVLVLGIAEPLEPLGRFPAALAAVVERNARPGESHPLTRPVGALRTETVVPPREAFLGIAERVPVQAAIGRVSCESIAGYPPGIPALLPGERITDEVIAYLRTLQEAGARLHGASDPEFHTIHVLAHVEAGGA